MATSSKVQFNLDKLKENALESIDERLRLARLHVDSFDDDEAWAQRVLEWRAAQEAKISEVFSRLGDGGISNKELTEFSIDAFPKPDRWDRSKAEYKLRDLESLRSQIVAKSESLVADEAGNIALTKTQLAEFFGL